MKKRTKKEIPVDVIKASIKTDKWYFAEGLTKEQAIANLQPFARGKGILVLEKGDLRREKILNAMTVAGAFGNVNKLTKEIALRNIVKVFDGF